MVVQQHRRTGGAVAVAAAVLGVMAAGGCSGEGAGSPAGAGPVRGTSTGRAPEPAAAVSTGAAVSSGAAPERTAGLQGPPDVPDAAQGARRVREAADALIAAGSARARTFMESATGGTRVTIRGEGGYDFRRRMGRLTVVLPEEPSGADSRRPVTELMTTGALYLKNRGAGVPADKWVRVDTATLADGNLVTGGATDPLAAAELLRSARDVTFVGVRRFGDGTAVRHYRGSADIERAALLARGYARDSLTAAAKGFARDSVPFDVFLDDRGRVRKVRHQFSFTNGKRTVAVTSTTELYAFGTPVTVRLPDRRDIYAGRISG
ncbi:hypothetical protein [Streptomyces sp. CAU 1734]|uniref:hypothetical protein n=1 Tax=Streptomyces sp. CAU 1734 TaxID=3140360 RepID=UPI0032614BDC